MCAFEKTGLAAAVVMTDDPMKQFKAALAQRGIIPPASIVEGRIGRADVESKHGKGDASYMYFANGIPAGGFENHRDGLGWETWRADIGRPLSSAELETRREREQAARLAREVDEAQRRATARECATAIWDNATPAPADHAYLVRKGIAPHGLRLYRGNLAIGGMGCDGALVVPLREGPELQTVEFIAPDGTKRFLPGGRKQGSYYSIGKPNGLLCIAEGYATAASIHKATGHAVAVAFDAGNLEAVAVALGVKLPDVHIIICADDDYRTAGNPGLTKAAEAARAVGGLVAIPDFGADRPNGATDFNDMYQHRGAEAVNRAIANAHAPDGQSPQAKTSSVAAGNLSGRSSTAIVRRLSDIEAKPIRWLWPGRIARGKVSMIVGHPDLGKSQVTAALAAVVTTGGKWPVDRTACECGDVILLNAEDDAADTIRPRLEAAGANVTRIEIIEAVTDGFRADGEQQIRGFNLKADLGVLAALLSSRPNVALVVIDPVSAYLSGVDTHVNADVRAILAPLGELAARYGVAIVCVSHLNKGGANKASAGDALLRVSGSLAFVAAARAAYIVTRDQDNPARRLFLPAKNNVGREQAGLAFTVESYFLSGGIETSRVLWEPDPVTITADEAIAASVPDEERTMTDEAVAFLQARLSNGARLLGREIKREAADAGISDKALRSARRRLGIKPEAEGFGKDRGTYWRLPGTAAGTPKAAYLPSPPINALVENRAHMDPKGTYGGTGDATPADLERF